MMRRLLMLVTVALVMAAMMVAMAAPAFAERDTSSLYPGQSGARIDPCNSGSISNPSGHGTVVYLPVQAQDARLYAGTCDFFHP